MVNAKDTLCDRCLPLIYDGIVIIPSELHYNDAKSTTVQERTMFSLQTIIGKGDKFYGLLEASSAAARESAVALCELLETPQAQRSLEKFKLARQREKHLADQISSELVNTFVTALEREDIESLSNVL